MCVYTPNDANCPDDGEYCTGTESCHAVLDCISSGDPCDDGVGCTLDGCNEQSDTCSNTADDSLCDDGLYCNGAELCHPTLDCQTGTDPCGVNELCCEDSDTCAECCVDADCVDLLTCTDDSCVDGACEFTANNVYAASGLALAIPDNNVTGVSHTISVPDSFTITDVDIDLQVTHALVGDLIVEVEHNATTVRLIDRMGGAGTCDSNDLDVILDDDGTGGLIEDLCGPTNSDPVPTSPPNYIPDEVLSAFNGMDSSGNWTITVIDADPGQAGTLDGWSIHVCDE
jgi:hypothetical protein